MSMRRLGILSVIVVIAVVSLVASGVIHVDIRPPSGADANPFWREKPTSGTLPDGLGIWVEVSRAVRPAVVNISTTEKVKSPLGDDLFSRLFEGQARRPRTALGSGFIVSADGFVVTNFHVVREAAEIVVRTADQREHVAKPRDLTRWVAGTPPGTAATLRVARGGETRTVEVTLGELRDAEGRR